jgi:hypothetical protein
MSFAFNPIYADDIQLVVASVLALLLFIAAAVWHLPRMHSAGWRRTGYAILIACSLSAAWANFFQSRNTGTWVHYWDIFHTAIGAKYFDELGYDHLYDCAYVLGHRHERLDFRRVTKMRDLGTLQLRKVAKLVRDSDCEARFTPARKQAFLNDVIAFGDLGLRRRWHDAFKDKGYNGTPFYTLIAGSVFGRVAIDRESLTALALIDIALLALAIVIVARTRGVVVALLVLAFLCVCYPARFVHMGGSFLRFDYIAALLMGFCALASQRALLAGMLLGYATFVRAFPLLFVGAVFLSYAALWLETRKLPREALSFAIGAATAAVVFGGATIAFGGASDWLAWWHEVRAHTKQSAAFRIGFKHMFMLDGNLAGDEGFVPYEDKARHFEDRRSWYWLATALLTLPIVSRAFRLKPASFGPLLGGVLFFVLLVATRYYYAVVVVFLLIDPRCIGERVYALMVGFLMSASAVTYVIAEKNPHAPFLNNTVSVVWMTFFVATLAAWSGYQTWREYRTAAASHAATAS